MKIESVRIQNLRSYMDETISFNDYSCLVGPNGCGKSNLLFALNIFFRYAKDLPTDTRQLSEQDFHNKNTKEPINITLTFCDINEEAQKDFQHYYRQNKLIFTAEAVFNQNSGKAEVKHYGSRLVMKDFSPFFAALDEKIKVADLRDIYQKIMSSYPDLPDEKTKDGMLNALREYEESRPEQCTLNRSEDQFYGASKGTNRLEKYIHWEYIPAVKDATHEDTESGSTVLGRILQRTVRAKINFKQKIEQLMDQTKTAYAKMLDAEQGVLENTSKDIQKKLSEWAHPGAEINIQWNKESEKSIKIEEPFAQTELGEGIFKGDVSRFGHGMQRSYLFAMLHELSECDEVGAPTLILGCEEPELYQHPPQAKHICAVFQKLSEANAQVIVSTHSPNFVSGKGFENIRIFRKSKGVTNCRCVTIESLDSEIRRVRGDSISKPEGTMAKIHQLLQPAINEMFFSTRVVLVEGYEDFAYLKTYFELNGLGDEFRKNGWCIIPCNGKSEIVKALVIAQQMGIPYYVVFDSDANKHNEDVRHRKDNKAILSLCGHDDADPMPADTFWGNRVTMWSSEIAKVAKEDIGSEAWDKYKEKALIQFQQENDLKKNTLFIGSHLCLLWESDLKSDHLIKLCFEILESSRSDH